MKQRIRLLPDERELLLSLYQRYRVPTDQFLRRPDEMRRFAETFNTLTGRTDRPGELLRYMVTQRKNGDWHRFDGDHRKLTPLDDDLLDANEWVLLGEVYEAMGAQSDEVAYDDDLCEELAQSFAKRAGRVVHGMTLLALLIKKRKRGLLPCLQKGKRPFSDIEEVARREKKPG